MTYYLELCDAHGCQRQNISYSDMHTAIATAKRFLMNPRIEHVQITNAKGDVLRVLKIAGIRCSECGEVISGMAYGEDRDVCVDCYY